MVTLPKDILPPNITSDNCDRFNIVFEQTRRDRPITVSFQGRLIQERQ
jgi:hypothetical protein